MNNNSELLYYSTNTLLSSFIAKNFYRGEHFVWCSPVYDPTALDRLHRFSQIPPSSSPCYIYKCLHDESIKGDLHSRYIEGNRAGLRRGAAHHYEAENVTDEEYARILKIIDKAESAKFKPLLYLIPARSIANKLIHVDVEAAANPLSVEYQIPNLTPDEFDAIELWEA